MPPAVPASTYRLQLTAKFGFAAAADLVPYLAALGISYLYASPFLKARAGSTHGYDIVDHNCLNPEFGGDEGFAQLSKALAAADMGLMLDFVPNHMGVAYADNAWWLDVLEWGPRSPHAASFDIDWETLPYRPQGGILLPILGKSYGDALEDGDLALKYDPKEGTFSAWYYEHRLPIRPNRYGEILKNVVEQAGAQDEDAGRRLLEFAARYPDPNAPSREQAAAYKAELAAIDGGAEVIERGLDAYRPNEADPDRILLLHRLLERQHYRVAYWRVAFTEINYRRFFDVNDLAGLRVEDLPTFEAAHRRVMALIASGELHALRLDHIDGLSDPVQYTRRLSRLVRAAREPGARARPFYIVVEKILADGEPMPDLPGVAGTTGYDVLNVLTRVLLDDSGLLKLDKLYSEEIVGHRENFDDIVRDAKVRVLETILASEFTVLCRLLSRIAAGHWRSRDFTFERLRTALRAYVVHFPVYRTYSSGGSVSAEDRTNIAETIAKARAHWFGPDADILDFLQEVLTLDLVGEGRAGYSNARVKRFTGKVQQLTGPVMAKALEDTAFYRYHRLLALNEVGGDPALPAITAGEFHRRMRARTAFPQAMTATATHDTKRGEDARTRILAIADLADDWSAAVQRWQNFNEPLIRRTPDRAPTVEHEYMLYQALVGAWPVGGPDQGFVERMQTYAVKALREGKQQSSWHIPNESYETATTTFIARLLSRENSPKFLDDFGEFAARTSLIGALNSLAQLTLKATIPGIPDFYQGTEFWDLSLVDPDNRRPVDFAARRSALETLTQSPDWSKLAAQYSDGLVKLALTHRLLALRNEMRELFTSGNYEPIEVEGTQARHVIAYARTLRRDVVIVAVARHFGPLTDGGRRWPQANDFDAVLKLDGYAISDNYLGPVAPSLRGAIHANALFGALPVVLMRAIRRR